MASTSRVRRRQLNNANGNGNGNGNGSDHTRPIDRVRRLEELVASLTADRQCRGSSTGSGGSEGERRARSSVSAASAEGELFKSSSSEETVKSLASSETPPVDRFGRLEINNGQPVYLSAAHWATICDEVSQEFELSSFSWDQVLWITVNVC